MPNNFNREILYDEEDLQLGAKHLRRLASGTAQSLATNEQAYRTWYRYLFELTLAAFEWEGLPPEIDPRFMEYTLVRYGFGGFFSMREGLGFYGFAQAAPIGGYNMYYNPNKVNLIPPTGGESWIRHMYYFLRGDILYEPDAVPLWDSVSRKPLTPLLRYYARRLAHIDRTVDVNIMAQQTPYLITTTEQGRKDAEQFVAQVTGHTSNVIVNSALADSVTAGVLDLGVPYVADKLLVDQQKILNNFYTMIGVDNTNTEKRERMVSKEATSNNEQILIIRNSRLRVREDFCKKVAHFTDGRYTPTVKYCVPYRLDGTPDMGGM